MAVSKRSTKQRAPTPAEKRAKLLADAREAFLKLKKGKALTEREARILSNCHNAFMELYDVFRPSIKATLEAQGESIAALLEEAETEDEEDDEDEDEE